MVWSCEVCTFENRNDAQISCELCESRRSNAERGSINAPQLQYQSSSSTISRAELKQLKKPVQATLFGGVAKISDPKTTDQSKKRKEPQKNLKTTISNVKSDVREEYNDSFVGNSIKSESATLSMRQDKIEFLISSPGKNAAKSIEELAQSAKNIMRNIFGVRKLRSLQPDAVTCGLKKQSQIVIMATGGGKSLCYQLPALVLGGTSIVVSPLIALMQDQVQALTSKGIQAALISSNNGEKNNLDVMERLVGRSLRASRKNPGPFVPVSLLYVTPEQVQTARFRDILKDLNHKKKLTMFAIDEAHCLSAWGHDFRKSYMELGYLRVTYPNVPLMACTATATPSVLEDIKNVLHLENAPCHMGSFDRPNIFYKVKYRDALDAIRPGGAVGDLINFVKKQHKRADATNDFCSGIIYVHTRQQTTEIAREIHEKCGIKTVAYHAGLKVADRNHAQEAWTSGEAKVAVATVAFGMGIDLGHVRYVVHWTISKSIEAFYQESGRAGRDGLPSISLVYFSKDDASKYRFLLSTKQTKEENVEPSARDVDALERMVQYCTVPGCRRLRLLKHFGEVMKDPKGICEKSCDFCENPEGVTRAIEAASSAKDFTLHVSDFVDKSRSNAFVSRSYGDDAVEKPFSVGGLGVTEAGASFDYDELDSDLKPTANFKKVSEILSKYEVSTFDTVFVCHPLRRPQFAISLKAIETKGFVRFKQKQSKGFNSERVDDRIRIPKHLVPPSTKLTPSVKKAEEQEEKTSSDYASEAERLRKELEALRAASELQRQQLQASKSANGDMSKRPLAAPPPVFSSKKQRK